MSGIYATLVGAGLWQVLKALMLFLVGYILVKILMKVFVAALEKAKIEATLSKFLQSTVKVGMWAIIGVVIADAFGIPVTSLVAALSVAGVALSLSLQSILSNLFSGVTLLIAKPFVVGDFIEASGQSGVVLAIGLINTTIVTPDKKEITLPNGDVCATSIVNYTRSETRRVDITIGISYKCKPEDVRDALLLAANSDKRVLQDIEPVVLLSGYQASNIEYVLRAWVKTADYWDVYFALNESCGKHITEAGLEMAFDQVDVHIINNK